MPSINRNEQKNDPSNSARGPSVAIGAGTLAEDSRYVLIGTAGNIVGKLIGDAADVTYVLPVGLHKMAFRSVTSATAVGFFLI
jgi:hypothetical protein